VARIRACEGFDLDWDDTICTGDATVRPDGTYELLVPPGTYKYIELEGASTPADWNFGHRWGFLREDVTVTDDMVLDWDLTAMVLTINLVNAAGTPVSALMDVSCGQAVDDPWFARQTGASADVTGQATLTIPTDNDEDWQCYIYGLTGDPDHPSVDITAASGERELTIVVPEGTVLEGGPDDNVADADGVPDMVEHFGPNGGDGNGDGTPDNEQTHVASLPQEGGSLGDGFPYLTVAGPAGSELADVVTRAPKGLPSPPVGVSLPAGLASFVLEGIAAGSTQTVSMYVGSTDGVNGYAKYDEADGWSLLPAGRVQVHPDRVDVTLTDGGVGDADGVADGRITDPGGLAVVEGTADSTPPVVTGERLTSPNANGWYAGNVTVRWTATDESGIAAPPPDTVVSGEGASLVAESALVCDLAPTPNCATGTLAGIRIDRTPPAVAVSGAADGATYILGGVPATGCQAADPLSGLQGACTVSTSGGTSRGIGSYLVTARAVDRAGNVRTTRVRYQVVYGFDGFQPPLNDWPGAPMSVFQRGSTVTLAFVLRRSNGSVVTPASAPTWLTPQRGARTQARVNEATAGQRTTSGSRFVWRNGRWEYTWSTRNASAGYIYRLGARLDDGTTHTINIGVR
jgi:hypothetical protein